MTCPYCLSLNAEATLVCITCSRDIAVPATLVSERDELLRKRDIIREELLRARCEVEMIRHRKQSR
jgi:hypothetical protein